ncbi:MAG: tRNA (adenosine(37)-N6)-threonylcarbamoyltransferase complex ATPase subunit type 1 TsaE [Candidatus Terrybacteria bacterium]|nr:tRNA (adenosine(37)-N6)-threonylcarbamoyltransferase complex ATPase subunit type 1 TsaE [Candidatus Terrybacteria bacterium]
MKKISISIKQTKEIAGILARKILRLRSGRGAVIVGLSGELGSGKTTFSQCFARALGIKEKIHSPTFVIFRKHEIRNPKSLPADASHQAMQAGETNSKSKNQKFKTLYHFDVYRIKKPKEIIDLGWRKIISDSKNIILVEWPEKIKKIFPKKHFWINFTHLAPKKRGIDIYLHK